MDACGEYETNNLYQLLEPFHNRVDIIKGLIGGKEDNNMNVLEHENGWGRVMN